MKTNNLDVDSKNTLPFRQLPQILMCEWQSRWYLICSQTFSKTFGAPSQITCGKVQYMVNSENKMSHNSTLVMMLEKIIQTENLIVDRESINIELLAQNYKIIGRLSQNRSEPKSSKIFQALSKRELEVLRLISQGFSVKSISASLEISTHTVSSYHKTIYRKLGVNSKISALNKAQSIGLL